MAGVIKTTFLFALYCLCSLSSLSAFEDIIGFWKRKNPDNPQYYQCMIAVYEYQGKGYGKFVCTYDANGKIDDMIYAPRVRAPGLVGHPYYCGLDFIWDLESGERMWKGKIVDPRKGKIYGAELWREDENLVILGELLIFGKAETWYPATEDDFSPEFKKPDVSKLVPVIPQVE